MQNETRRHPRAVGLEERFATLLPEVLISLGLAEFAALAAKAMQPKPVLELSLAHIHAPTVSVKEQAAIVVDRLRRAKTMTFRALAGDAADTLTRVARFLSLLELFREGAVAFDQVSPLGELTIRWTGSEEGEVTITDEFDGAPEDGEDGADGDSTDDDSTDGADTEPEMRADADGGDTGEDTEPGPGPDTGFDDPPAQQDVQSEHERDIP
jgi:segregation and condensation protein A